MIWLAQRRRLRQKGATADHRVMALAEHHRTQHTRVMPGVVTFNTGGLAQSQSHLQAPTKHRKAHSNATKVGHDALRFMFYAGPVHYTLVMYLAQNFQVISVRSKQFTVSSFIDQ